MTGYKNDYSMSNNAAAAYENGEKPLSKWTKKSHYRGRRSRRHQPQPAAKSPEIERAARPLPHTDRMASYEQVLQ